MFDSLPPEPAALREADDATVAAAIKHWGQVEAAAGARRLDAIAELVRRQADDDDRVAWACDPWDSVAAEVASALNLRHRKASGQMHIAVTLRERLPRLGALFLAGQISAQLVSTIAWRTRLIIDEEALRQVDTAIAERASTWGRLSEVKLEQAIDRWVNRYDPGGLRHAQSKARSREVCFGGLNDEDPAGTRAMWGRLYATDAQLLERRLQQMANGVCEADPRTLPQRRADAMGALAVGSDRLSCQCGAADCPNSDSDGRAASVVIHVVTDEAALTDQPHTTARPAAGLLMGGGILPAPLLADLVNNGAAIRPLPDLGDSVPEPRYVPSAKLQEFVRCRDLTCRFPGCEQPAEFCDIDHTIPYPIGPTHPSNLKCLCRKHHLLKTFWSGIDGWADQQSPDGTITWTSPTGQSYTTKPGGKLFFPQWNTATGRLPRAPMTTGPPRTKGLMMPKRRRTRAAETARRIADERALNDADVAERNRPPPF